MSICPCRSHLKEMNRDDNICQHVLLFYWSFDLETMETDTSCIIAFIQAFSYTSLIIFLCFSLKYFAFVNICFIFHLQILFFPV